MNLRIGSTSRAPKLINIDNGYLSAVNAPSRFRSNTPAIGFIILLCLILNLSGCETTGYYSQAVSGHFSLLYQRRTIEKYLDASSTPSELKGQLEKVMAMRKFAEQQLGLPVKSQYRHYVELDRRHVVWNVFAAPELSMQPLSWCYPVAGCTTYRGYFKQQNAIEYANKLAKQGYDVYVAGVSAYSTLGWFKDPVLSTYINRSEPQLANLLFHELAHQLLYIKDDTAFNESFATLVALEGVKRWLNTQQQSSAYRTFLQDQEKENAFVELISNYREKLEQLYLRRISPDEKKQRKKVLILKLKEAHEQLKERWGGNSDYQKWFDQPLNNAQLNTVTTYFDWVPALEYKLKTLDGDMQRFYDSCRELAGFTASKRKEHLKRLTVKAVAAYQAQMYSTE